MGVSKAQYFEGKYKGKLEFPEGLEDSAQKTIHLGDHNEMARST